MLRGFICPAPPPKKNKLKWKNRQNINLFRFFCFCRQTFTVICFTTSMTRHQSTECLSNTFWKKGKMVRISFYFWAIGTSIVLLLLIQQFVGNPPMKFSNKVINTNIKTNSVICIKMKINVMCIWCSHLANPVKKKISRLAHCLGGCIGTTK